MTPNWIPIDRFCISPLFFYHKVMDTFQFSLHSFHGALNAVTRVKMNRCPINQLFMWRRNPLLFLSLYFHASKMYLERYLTGDNVSHFTFIKFILFWKKTDWSTVNSIWMPFKKVRHTHTHMWLWAVLQ